MGKTKSNLKLILLALVIQIQISFQTAVAPVQFIAMDGKNNVDIIDPSANITGYDSSQIINDHRSLGFTSMNFMENRDELFHIPNGPLKTIGTGDLTILMWVKYIRTGVNQNLIYSKYSNGTTHFDLWLSTSYNLKLWFGGNIYDSDVALINQGEWTQLGFQYVQSATTIEFVQDGALASTSPLSVTLDFSDLESDIILGQYHDGTNIISDTDLISEFALYNTVFQLEYFNTCQLGQYYDEDSRRCKQCDDGKVCLTSALNIGCQPGPFRANFASGCACNAGFTETNSHQGCTCPDGQFGNSATGQCEDCDPKYSTCNEDLSEIRCNGLNRNPSTCDCISGYVETPDGCTRPGLMGIQPSLEIQSPTTINGIAYDRDCITQHDQITPEKVLFDGTITYQSQEDQYLITSTLVHNNTQHSPFTLNSKCYSLSCLDMDSNLMSLDINSSLYVPIVKVSQEYVRQNCEMSEAIENDLEFEQFDCYFVLSYSMNNQPLFFGEIQATIKFRPDQQIFNYESIVRHLEIPEEYTPITPEVKQESNGEVSEIQIQPQEAYLQSTFNMNLEDMKLMHKTSKKVFYAQDIEQAKIVSDNKKITVQLPRLINGEPSELYSLHSRISLKSIYGVESQYYLESEEDVKFDTDAQKYFKDIQEDKEDEDYNDRIENTMWVFISLFIVSLVVIGGLLFKILSMNNKNKQNQISPSDDLHTQTQRPLEDKCGTQEIEQNSHTQIKISSNSNSNDAKEVSQISGNKRVSQDLEKPITQQKLPAINDNTTPNNQEN